MPLPPRNGGLLSKVYLTSFCFFFNFVFKMKTKNTTLKVNRDRLHISSFSGEKKRPFIHHGNAKNV